MRRGRQLAQLQTKPTAVRFLTCERTIEEKMNELSFTPFTPGTELRTTREGGISQMGKWEGGVSQSNFSILKTLPRLLHCRDGMLQMTGPDSRPNNSNSFFWFLMRVEPLVCRLKQFLAPNSTQAGLYLFLVAPSLITSCFIVPFL